MATVVAQARRTARVRTVSESAHVQLDGDELSFLIGMCRVVIDECDELLKDPLPYDAKGDERAWLDQRRQVARAMENKLERAGRRL